MTLETVINNRGCLVGNYTGCSKNQTGLPYGSDPADHSDCLNLELLSPSNISGDKNSQHHIHLAVDMAEHTPLGHSMCVKCRKIDFRGAFFMKRTQPVDMLELCLDNVFCDIAHILNTYQECRCCSLIHLGIQRFYPALLDKQNTKVSWHREGTRARVEVQSGEVEYRSVVYIFLGMDIDRGNLAINLLSPQIESVASNAALRAHRVS